MSDVELRHERIEGDGVALHVVRAGAGPPVILLHGFPENWRSWRRQVEPLVGAGFSVLLPDLRGYNLSDIPAGRDAYRLVHLVEDVAALVRASGRARAHVVGHDWGGIVAWHFAARCAPLLDKLVIMNSPHPGIFARQVRRPPQLFKSWYAAFFLLPYLPELALSAADYGAIRHMFARMPARSGAFSAEDIDAYVAAMKVPGALTAALNYYRANALTRMPRTAGAHRIEAETLVIWGEKDPALGIGLLDGLDRKVARLRVHRIPDAGHWVQNEAPEEVNRVLTEFLAGPNVKVDQHPVA